MEIIGRGFLARHLAGIAGDHDGVVALAAGVSCAAGTSPADFAREAALVTRVAARCRDSGERLLFFSTASTGMYGAGGHGREDEPVAPISPYGRHKHELERVVTGSGADYLVARLAHVVGPAQPPHQLIPALMEQILRGQVVLHVGAKRDIIDVIDVVGILSRLLTAGTGQQLVNIATGWAVPVEDLATRIEAILGTRARRAWVRRPPVNHLVSTAKLRRLVPEVAAMEFGPRYFEAVLDRYLSAAVLI